MISVVPTHILQLHYLFLSNFHQRYELSHRTFKKYFQGATEESYLDNTIINLNRIQPYLERFLVAIPHWLIHELIQYYDIYDNQQLSYLEFYQLFANPEQFIEKNANKLTQLSKQTNEKDKLDDASENSFPETKEESILGKKTSDLRDQSEVESAEVSKLKKHDFKIPQPLFSKKRLLIKPISSSQRLSSKLSSDKTRAVKNLHSKVPVSTISASTLFIRNIEAPVHHSYTVEEFLRNTTLPGVKESIDQLIRYLQQPPASRSRFDNIYEHILITIMESPEKQIQTSVNITRKKLNSNSYVYQLQLYAYDLRNGPKVPYYDFSYAITESRPTENIPPPPPQKHWREDDWSYNND